MAIPTVSDWLDWMPDTVTLDAYVSKSESQEPTYAGAPVSYQAYIEMKNHRIVDHRGREIIARGTIYLGTTTVPDIRSKLTLPGRFVPANPPILSVNAASDETGTHHVVLEIG